MTITVDPDRLNAAMTTVRSDLLSEVDQSGHWVGQLAGSPLATATAISALVLAEQHGQELGDETSRTGPFYEVYQSDLSEMIINSLHWLAERQNEDGGWGDTDRCRSNIATTMLVRAAFQLTGEPAKYKGLLTRADQYVKQQGGLPALRRRYGRDKTFAVPILTNCALSGGVPWRQVPPLPFEFACLPKKWFRFLRLPVVSYAIPALVAIGQARFFHRPPLNPITRFVRRLAVDRGLDALESMQPASGGYLEAVPLTSFVVMSLASTGRAEHKVTRRGVEFLLDLARPDGSWPIDANLATWNTSQAVTALAASPGGLADCLDEATWKKCLDWLLACQHQREHAMTGAAAGGWAWTDLSGGVPDTDDTSAALLALAAFHDLADSGGGASIAERKASIERAAHSGAKWLLAIQNDNGGWPTFCRGWGKLPFDRSACELTAHALRALHAWRDRFKSPRKNAPRNSLSAKDLESRIEQATVRGLAFLAANQNGDGSWTPLWFGNQASENEENRVFGTARVLLAYGELDKLSEPPAQLGMRWLLESQDASGGWGATDSAHRRSIGQCSVEETAVACQSLLRALHRDDEQSVDPTCQNAAQKGLDWLTTAIEEGRHQQPTPIGLYFARLWYYEQLYPTIFSAATLGAATALQPKTPSSASNPPQQAPISVTSSSRNH